MDIVSSLFFLIVLIPSAIIHEYMHGWTADRLGDPTARYAGRLTLDPRAHVDPIGTLALPLIMLIASAGSFMFAYAKPVPYNPYNLKNQKWGSVMVAFAGPISNFILALIFGLFVQLSPAGPLTELLAVVVYANVLLAVFNLVPIPPLDGSKLLYAILPDSLAHIKQTLERYGWVLLLVFIFMFSSVLFPIMQYFYTLFLTTLAPFM